MGTSSRQRGLGEEALLKALAVLTLILLGLLPLPGPGTNRGLGNSPREVDVTDEAPI
jgi:hypothetical protein